ncbi:MAG: hypothetical protein V4641_20000 [Pseudomonadota bacterium]
MAIYDLYGFLSSDIDRARNLLEASLDIKFEVRDSDYQGGEYFQWGKTSNEHFVLKRNVDSIDGKPAEISFPDHPVLFYVHDTQRSDELQARISQGAEHFDLLRHEDLN